MTDHHPLPEDTPFEDAFDVCGPCGQPDDCTMNRACFGEKARSFQLSPAATLSRYNAVPPATPQNSYEKGVFRDDRGLPVRDGYGNTIPIKKYHERRHEFDQKLAAVKAGTT